MISSAKLALSILFQRIRSSSLGRNLKEFILRCLLLWPRILRSLRKVWSWYFQTSPNDDKNTKGDSDTEGPSSTGALRKHEECVVVCASQAFGRVPAGEPSRHFMSGSSDAEPPIPMEDTIRRNPSVPRSLSIHAPSRQGSPRLSVPPSTQGSPHTSASSLREGSALDSMEWFMHRSNAPVNWTHSRAAGRQFTSRSHPRPSSPSPFPFLRHPSRPNTPMRSDIDIPTRLAMIQHSLDSDGSPAEIPIDIKEPSRPGTPEDTRSVCSSSPPQFPSPSVTVHGRTQNLSTHHQLPSTEFVNLSADSKGDSPSGYGTQIGAHQSKESMRPQGSMTLRSTQAPPRPSFTFPAPITFPEPSITGVSTQASTMNAGHSPFRHGIPPEVRPMNSDQVSRYLKNGDVPRKESEFWLLPMQVNLRHSYEPKFCNSGDWTPIMHPGGTLYFYHETKSFKEDFHRRVHV